MLTVVRKPWGYEYPIFESEQVGLWFLCIKPGQSTSLHCHPRKKTGLVVLEGAIEVSFLNDSTRLGPTDRVMIRPGLFHRSTACSDTDSYLLEIENPRDKEDLVRFEDNYGRESMPYEDDSHHVALSEKWRVLPPIEDWQTNIAKVGQVSLLWHHSCELKDLVGYQERTTVLVVAGSLGEDSREVLGAGDVVSLGTLRKLVDRFSIATPLSLLTLQLGSQ
jgi:mannose-6-phosphate isomerase-like protein (cupin superfamily)